MSLSPVVDNSVNNLVSLPPPWDALKNHLRTKVSQVNYNNWFRPISNVRLDGDILTVSVPNKFIADWISDYYSDLIEKEAAFLFEKRVGLRFEIHKEEEEVFEKSRELKKFPGIQAGSEIASKPVEEDASFKPIRIQSSAPLNSKYTFDTFVVGSGNQLAHAAAKAVAELPGAHYNPLFLYGGVGLGKTHLLHAAGIGILQRKPNAKIFCISSEKFMNEFIHSVRHDKMIDFRKKYRDSCDVLLIDDIQFLGGKESTQDEFFHTFNALHDTKRQIVVTSDKIPKEIPGLEERLCSRFEWGLVADIQAPDFETRVAILRKKAETDKIVLRDDVAMFLAKEVKSNVRELEGALIRLHAFATLKKSSLTLDLASEILKNILPSKLNRQGRCTIETIQQAVADYYQIKMSDLKSPRRHRELAYPRQVAMYLCKKHLKISYPEIGNHFGGKDHTTVIHAYRKIETLLEEDPNLQNDLAILEKSILH